jgi:hypothetical protein
LKNLTIIAEVSGGLPCPAVMDFVLNWSIPPALSSARYGITNIFVSVLTIGVAVSIGARGVGADNLSATDKELKISVPVLTNTLPVQLGSSFSTQYATDRTPDPSAGMLHLGGMTLEEGIQYPSLFGDVYSENSIGQKLTPSAKDGFPTMNPNSAYLTSWFNKQWASVNLNFTHTHLIEQSDNQLAVGVSKTISVLHDTLALSLGEHMVSDLDTHYLSRVMDLSVDYGWKSWNLSLSIEQRQDLNLIEHSVWTALKSKF